ncbi:MAG: alpha/beta hydrolase [Tunicatimonas sp.]
MAKLSTTPPLSFNTYGSGSEALLAFHGYGQNGSVYKRLAAALKNKYTIYSFDLYFHGKSPGWPSGQAVTVAQWQQSVSSVLAQYNIDRFSMVSYSLGARFALTLVETLGPRIDSMILIAPDGIKSSRWYQWASGTWLGNRLLRHTVVRPRPFFRILNQAYRLGIIEKSVLKFVKAHMDTRTKRLKVYTRWTAFRRVQPNRRRVRQACNAHQITASFFLGKYDAVVKSRAIVKFHKSLNVSTLIILPCGHANLIREVICYYENQA